MTPALILAFGTLPIVAVGTDLAYAAVTKMVGGAIHLAEPRDVCEQRDPKDPYARARRGEISGLRGQDAAYEPPLDPDVLIGAGPVEQALDQILCALERCIDESRS